jgi:uncharacterized metal-binding protein YceD (DUF177 family)
MSEKDFPISQMYELGRLSLAGDEVAIAPSADDLALIARWADVDTVEAFKARIELRKLSPTRFVIDAELSADIVQSCVVTLDPVRSHIERSFMRELFLSQAAQHAAKVVDIDVMAVDEDGREEIASLRYDLAIPVLEEFALAIDPYPRAAGVAFEAPRDDADSPEHPFAALKGLKSRS